jgi:hypothetical protein
VCVVPVVPQFHPEQAHGGTRIGGNYTTAAGNRTGITR